MKIGAIIEALDAFGIDVELGIKHTFRANKYSSPEADALLDLLASQRDEAIDYLLIGRFGAPVRCLARFAPSIIVASQRICPIPRPASTDALKTALARPRFCLTVSASTRSMIINGA